MRPRQRWKQENRWHPVNQVPFDLVSSKFRFKKHNKRQKPIQRKNARDASCEKIPCGAAGRNFIVRDRTDSNSRNDKTTDGKKNIHATSSIIFPMKKTALPRHRECLGGVDGMYPDDKQSGNSTKRLNRIQA